MSEKSVLMLLPWRMDGEGTIRDSGGNAVVEGVSPFVGDFILEAVNQYEVSLRVEKELAELSDMVEAGTIRFFTETDLEGNVRTMKVDDRDFILCSAPLCNNRATIAPKGTFNPATGTVSGYPGSYADRNDGLCDSCREMIEPNPDLPRKWAPR